MLKIQDVINAVEEFAPLDGQADYDNCGLLFGNPNNDINGIILTLDNNEDVVREAVCKGCNMIIEHHPSVFTPIKKLEWRVPKHRALALAIKNDIAIYSAHTSVDFAKGGLNDTVAELLGLHNIEVIGDVQSGARVGSIVPMCLDAFTKHVASVLGDGHVYYVGDPQKTVGRVAVINGAGGGSEQVLYEAQAAGADVFVSSEYKYNVIRLAKDLGYAIISFGHYDSEKPFCDLIKSVLNKKNINCVYIAESSTNPVN